MKLVLITIKIIFLLSHSFAADFEVTMTGKAEYPYFKEYEKDKIFLLYKNEAQYTTNTAMFGSQFAAASSACVSFACTIGVDVNATRQRSVS